MRHLTPATVLAIALSTLASPANAQSQAEMNTRADADFHRADAELNSLYRDLMTKIDGQGKSALRDAQRAWLKFRDTEGEFETRGSEGGSIHPMIVSQCLEDLTQQRERQLKAQVTCHEGDFRCGSR